MTWEEKTVVQLEPGEPLAEHVKNLLARQRRSWPLLAAGVDALASMDRRALDVDKNRVVLQANPGRRASVHARVDPASIAARPCFLCPQNLPAEERGIAVGDLMVLPNPFPIVANHLTIPSRVHAPQRLAGREEALLQLARALGPNMLVFYNGPECGASAPDHFHFQAGASAEVPLLAEIRASGPDVEVVSASGRNGLLLRGDQRESVGERLIRVRDRLQEGEGTEEPPLNVVATHREGTYNVFVFPRAAHRPRCYFAEEPERVSVSPAALEMMGFLVLADVDHLDRVDAAVARAVFEEVCVGRQSVERLLAEVT